tara:strand:+ start:190 stop:618 length:429 start_codon:yes stop_codon:yes gene_type:complete
MKTYVINYEKKYLAILLIIPFIPISFTYIPQFFEEYTSNQTNKILIGNFILYALSIALFIMSYPTVLKYLFLKNPYIVIDMDGIYINNKFFDKERISNFKKVNEYKFQFFYDGKKYKFPLGTTKDSIDNLLYHYGVRSNTSC